jgi:hypothetical protein
VMHTLLVPSRMIYYLLESPMLEECEFPIV